MNTDDTMRAKIEESITSAMRQISDHRETFVRAFLAEVGCLPSEAEMVEQRDLDGVTTLTLRRRTSACTHLRQAPDHGDGGDGLVDIDLLAVLPCADPACKASTEGDDLVMVSRGGQKVYRRYACPAGWRWFKKDPE
jgi:hypothetical protein